MSEISADDTVVLFDGYSEPVRTIGVRTDGDAIMFFCHLDSGTLLTNPLVTDNGMTLGDRNRALLLNMLNEWLNTTIGATCRNDH
jgi:hypothetical protein